LPLSKLILILCRFTAGSRETLETQPNELGLDVSAYLLRFFRDHYVASRATLVVVCNDELRALDRWVSPFSSVMSQKRGLDESHLRPFFPDINVKPDLVQTVILRSNDDYQVDENIQTLSIEWPLSLVYSNGVRTRQPSSQHIITAPAVGFIISQIVSRRGPGSLRNLLEKFNWVPKDSLTRGVPRISFPVDVNGFQVLRLELGLTLEGFSNRSAVVAAVFECIRTSISKPIQLELIKQYLSTAWLHGYLLVPRPPDAIALAVDALRFGAGGTGIGVPGYWHLIPPPDDRVSATAMRDIVTDTLNKMSSEEGAFISVRASQKAIFGHSQGIIDPKITTPPIFSPWNREPITGARYLVESRIIGGSSLFKSFAWFAANFDGVELTPPFLNPLIPTRFRPPRPVITQSNPVWGRRLLYLEDANALEESRRWRLTTSGLWREYEIVSTPSPGEENTNWKLWQIPQGKTDMIGLPLPLRPPEPTIEGAVVIQLLSSLPSSFTPRQLVLANLWLLSLDDAILDLVSQCI
jgi:insulysin